MDSFFFIIFSFFNSNARDKNNNLRFGLVANMIFIIVRDDINRNVYDKNKNKNENKSGLIFKRWGKIFFFFFLFSTFCCFVSTLCKYFWFAMLLF